MDLLIFLKEHWVVLSGLGAILFASITIVFNVVYRYKEIPSLKQKIDALEEDKDGICLFHDDCIGGVKEDIQRLEEKVCKNLVDVNTTLKLMDKSREEAKDTLHSELVLIHEALGEMKGKMHVSR